LATRERVALYELSSFVKIEVSGPGAADYLEYLSANRVAREVGKVIYTSLLTDSGGIKADLTITRLGEDRFMVLTGGGSGMSDLEWIRRNATGDGSVYVQDVSSQYTSIGLWGPKAREVLGAVCEQDLSNLAFPYFSAQEITIETVPALALRISFVGELGWEIYTPSEYGMRLWDVLWEAGQAHGIIAAGMGAFDSLRLEKGYRALGTDIHVDCNPFEAGIDWAVRLDQDEFKGKEALLEIEEAGVSRKLCCLTLEEGTLLGKEPILKDDKGIGYVTSSNYAYSIGKQIAYGYLPVEYAKKGTQIDIEYFGKRLAAVVSDDPQYDPKMEKIKT
jgi:heterotetrameric sarcosine oxidase gamma subunit